MRARSLLIAALLALATLSVPPPSAHAAAKVTAKATARVTVTNEFGNPQADPTYTTELNLAGHGFQSIKNGHGGIYVFFGTVKGRWRPSQGGVTGEDYLYVPDAESKDNQGFQKFVAFPGSDTASAANGGTIKADGSWSTTIKVPGATFQAVDRDGQVATVDCRKVTCGIITIGAHGVTNANNESFTPISFANLYETAPTTGATTSPTTQPSTAPTQSATGNDTDETPGAGAGEEPGAGAGNEAPALAAALVDPDTAVVGRVLTFSGTGFTPGEQVTVSFDNGRAALGPLPAGASGEVAGVLQLPPDIRPGTHRLRLYGAASGARADLNFPITADTTASDTAADSTAGTSPEEPSNGLPGWAAWVFLTGALLLLAGAADVTVRRFRAIRASRSHATTTKTSSTGTGEQEPLHAS